MIRATRVRNGIVALRPTPLFRGRNRLARFHEGGVTRCRVGRATATVALCPDGRRYGEQDCSTVARCLQFAPHL